MVVFGFQCAGELAPGLGTIFAAEIIADVFPIDRACKADHCATRDLSEWPSAMTQPSP